MLVELTAKMNTAVRGLILFNFLYFILQNTFGITFKKPFAKDASFTRLKCDSESTAFEKILKTILECAVMCYSMVTCYGFYYQPDLMKCVGCNGFGYEGSFGIGMLVRNPECSPGWKAWRRSCYFFSTEEKSWEEALISCRQMRSELIEIDQAENQYLLTKIGSGVSHWIGLTDKNRTNVFIWNSSGEVATFSSWDYGQPSHTAWKSDENEDCVSAASSAQGIKWQDSPCGKANRYICERQTRYM